VGWFYAWAYLGFAAPFVVARLTGFVDMPRVLLGGSALAALSGVTVARELGRWSTPSGNRATPVSAAAVRQPRAGAR